MIKICDWTLALPLKLIFKDCLAQGIFPETWKRANIVPVRKRNSKNLKENYRPISLLPLFGKTFEKLIYYTVYEHLGSNDLLNPNQSGFRTGDSTINQLISIVHTISQAFDCNPTLEVKSLYLDISKAFDRVYHEGLIFKLCRCSVDGQLLSLIWNLLADRKQRTVLNSKTSDWGKISAGVPQGSILGPLFFLVYRKNPINRPAPDKRPLGISTQVKLLKLNKRPALFKRPLLISAHLKKLGAYSKTVARDWVLIRSFAFFQVLPLS